MMLLKIGDKVREYPNKPLNDALMYKLKDDEDNDDKTFTVGI